MTKVQLRFDLIGPVDDAVMEGIARAHGVYGIHHVRLTPGMDAVIVDYDATRLTPQDAERALHHAGIPVGARA